MMRRLLQVISWSACAGTVLPSFLFLAGVMGKSEVQRWMLLATIVWFVATPLWMGREHRERAPKTEQAVV